MSVLDGVIDQVAQNRLQALKVSDQSHLGVAGQGQFYRLAVSHGTKAAKQIFRNGIDVDRFVLKNLLPGFDSGKLQHSENQLQQTFGLFFNLLQEAVGSDWIRHRTSQQRVGAGLNDRQRSL